MQYLAYYPYLAFFFGYIVHAKSNEEEDEDAPLLPYTEEQQYLYFDLGLLGRRRAAFRDETGRAGQGPSGRES
jgi:hypothetical protein